MAKCFITYTDRHASILEDAMGQGSTAHQRVLVAQKQATLLLAKDELRQSELQGDAAALESALQETDRPEPQQEFIAVIKEVEGALCEEAIELEKRLALSEAELKHLLYDSDSLYLGSMARQLENKLYRYCRRRALGEARITPIQAEFGSLARLNLEEGTINRRAFKRIKKKFSNLELTVGELRGMVNGAAHPWLMHDPTTGKDRPVTKEYLQACINRWYNSSVFKKDAENVLACLEHLSTVMVEPLFVPITRRQAAEQAAMQASAQS